MYEATRREKDRGLPRTVGRGVREDPSPLEKADVQGREWWGAACSCPSLLTPPKKGEKRPELKQNGGFIKPVKEPGKGGRKKKRVSKQQRGKKRETAACRGGRLPAVRGGEDHRSVTQGR